MAVVYSNVLADAIQVIILIGSASTILCGREQGAASVTEKVNHYDVFPLGRGATHSLEDPQWMNDTRDIEIIPISKSSMHLLHNGIFYCQYEDKLCKCDSSLVLVTDNNTVPLNIWTLSEFQGENQLHSFTTSIHGCIESKHETFLRKCNGYIQLEERKLASDSLSTNKMPRCSNVSQRHIYFCSCLIQNASLKQRHIQTCSVQISYFSLERFKIVPNPSKMKSMTYVLLPKYCTNPTEIHKHNISDVESPTETLIGFKIVQFVLTTVSSLSLVMTLFVFATFKELRNIHSKNMTSLSLTFLFSQLICIYEAGIHNPESCLVIGVLLHYCWLSIFSWTSILSYELMLIFWTKTPSESTQNNTIYLKHAACSWIGPIPIILICLIIDLHQWNNVNVYSYNRDLNMCMLSKVTAVYSVIGPVSLYFIINIICFTLILYEIYSQKHSILKPWRPEDEYICSVFSKIILLLGVYWTLCLVAMYTESIVIWYVFSIFGNLHNLCIFASFVLIRNNTAIVINIHKNKQQNLSESSRTSENSNNNKIILQIVADLEP